MRPIFDRTRKPLSRRAPLPYSLKVKEWKRVRPLKRGTPPSPRLDAPEERLIGLVEPCQHVLQDVRVDGGVLRECGAEVLQLGFLLEARDGDADALPEP